MPWRACRGHFHFLCFVAQPGTLLRAATQPSLMEEHMNPVPFSKKGLELLQMYEQMARHGYDRQDNSRVEQAFSDFELRAYRNQIKPVLHAHQVSTVLDYGCGGSDWNVLGFDPDSNLSAKEYFSLRHAWRYEPARGIDERQRADCVISFDVLEHIFIADVPQVLRDMFRYASKLLVINVACYPAAARLPNGENAHVTVRDPIWWKGMVDCISTEFPQVAIWLICSTGWRQSSDFRLWSAGQWHESTTLTIDD